MLNNYRCFTGSIINAMEEQRHIGRVHMTLNNTEKVLLYFMNIELRKKYAKTHPSLRIRTYLFDKYGINMRTEQFYHTCKNLVLKGYLSYIPAQSLNMYKKVVGRYFMTSKQKLWASRLGYRNGGKMEQFVYDWIEIRKERDRIRREKKILLENKKN